jgi:cytochrome c553
MNKTFLSLICGLAALTAGCSNLERSRDLADPGVSGKTYAEQVCSNCHGLDGNPVSPGFPRLAGQQPDYIVAQLKNFRSHQRLDPPGYQYMWGLSRHLTDTQIDALADYYAHQTPKRVTAANSSDKEMAKGKQIFEQGLPEENVIACTACHGPSAQGMGPFPRLALQHQDYLLKQLNVFQNTQQRPGTPMDAVVHPLTGEDKAAVTSYLQAFPD